MDRENFSNSGLKSITIPATLTDWDYSFINCTSLVTVTLERGITEIPYSAFSGCTSLSNIVLPESLVEIGGSAFANCTSLKSLVIRPNTAITSSGTFSGWTAEQTIYIMESRYVISQYWYGPTSATASTHWFKDCNAKIVYDYTPE